MSTTPESSGENRWERERGDWRAEEPHHSAYKRSAGDSAQWFPLSSELTEKRRGDRQHSFPPPVVCSLKQSNSHFSSGNYNQRLSRIISIHVCINRTREICMLVYLTLPITLTLHPWLTVQFLPLSMTYQEIYLFYLLFDMIRSQFPDFTLTWIEPATRLICTNSPRWWLVIQFAKVIRAQAQPRS